jgi:hypothetical protein
MMLEGPDSTVRVVTDSNEKIFFTRSKSSQFKSFSSILFKFQQDIVGDLGTDFNMFNTKTDLDNEANAFQHCNYEEDLGNGAGFPAQCDQSSLSAQSRSVSTSSCETDIQSATVWIKSHVNTDSVVCGEAYSGDILQIECPHSQQVSEITFASFGTPTGECGSFALESSCHSTSTQEIVQNECIGKQKCAISASTSTFGNPCNSIEKRLLVSAKCTPSCGIDVCYNKDPDAFPDALLKQGVYTSTRSGCECNGKDCACCKPGGMVCTNGRQDVCVKAVKEWHDAIQQDISIVPVPNIWFSDDPPWEGFNGGSIARRKDNILVVTMQDNKNKEGIKRNGIDVTQNTEYCFDVVGRSIGHATHAYVSQGNTKTYSDVSLPQGGSSEFGMSSVCFVSSSNKVNVGVRMDSAKIGEQIELQSASLRKASERFVRRSFGSLDNLGLILLTNLSIHLYLHTFHLEVPVVFCSPIMPM